MGNEKPHGRKLAYLLRHDINYTFDLHGWREVCNLVENHGVSLDELRTIVATDDKQRFEFSEDGLYIRARQGHSINVDVQLEDTEPPEYLFRGTVDTRLNSIMEHGLCPMNRQYVHLSVDIETATMVGNRRKGDVVILRISAHKMWNDGLPFYLSRNNIWLTKAVPPQYINP